MDNVGLSLDLSLWILSALCFLVGLFAIGNGIREWKNDPYNLRKD